MWRKVCLIAGVLTGHLALLGWLQLAPEHDVAVAPPLRFQLTPAAQTIRSPAPAPTTQSNPLPPVSNKVKKSSLVALQRPSESRRPATSDPAVSAPAASLRTSLGTTDKTGETDSAHGAHAGVATLALATPETPAAATTVTLPSGNADYLTNPAPAYPAISRRLGEEGKVVIRVLIGKNGRPQQGDIGQSSGYPRLDQAALHAVMAWRYVPGRRDGAAQDMWFNVPIQFALE